MRFFFPVCLFACVVLNFLSSSEKLLALLKSKKVLLLISVKPGFHIFIYFDVPKWHIPAAYMP